MVVAVSVQQARGEREEVGMRHAVVLEDDRLVGQLQYQVDSARYATVEAEVLGSNIEGDVTRPRHPVLEPSPDALRVRPVTGRREVTRHDERSRSDDAEAI
jgi:hypothetical protein